jgi:hypothetical protein
MGLPCVTISYLAATQRLLEAVLLLEAQNEVNRPTQIGTRVIVTDIDEAGGRAFSI